MEVRISGKAITSLICGILSTFMPGIGFVLGVLGIVFGAMARNEIKHSEGKLTGNGMAVAGFICGIVGLASNVFWVSIIRIIGTAFKSSFWGTV